jgi:hypothetical protein
MGFLRDPKSAVVSYVNLAAIVMVEEPNCFLE